mmetsp:Transcript_2576/g.7612  ORF Transcript_2576/g.7612 Transcript_2576/m.7612 type:complete len:293 (-) Transcript_2576:61-939(-)
MLTMESVAHASSASNPGWELHEASAGPELKSRRAPISPRSVAVASAVWSRNTSSAGPSSRLPAAARSSRARAVAKYGDGSGPLCALLRNADPTAEASTPRSAHMRIRGCASPATMANAAAVGVDEVEVGLGLEVELQVEVALLGSASSTARSASGSSSRAVAASCSASSPRPALPPLSPRAPGNGTRSTSEGPSSTDSAHDMYAPGPARSRSIRPTATTRLLVAAVAAPRGAHATMASPRNSAGVGADGAWTTAASTPSCTAGDAVRNGPTTCLAAAASPAPAARAYSSAAA